MLKFTLVFLALSFAAGAQLPDPTLPKIIQKDGRYALLVDGAPYLVLGAQVNNSSAWPAMLPKVWPAMVALHVNTVEMPVYWEQFEPEKGRFDSSAIDTLLSQAREHHLHLILLWFGTWKNGSGHYIPQWMKLAPETYPYMLDAKGRPVDSLSPHSAATLDADTHAFTAFMRHLKEADPQHTVLMVQVENETGTWGAVRDYSPAAQKLFESMVPAKLVSALHKSPGTWSQVFGDDADEFFHAWSIAQYVGQVAAAGKAVNPLPLYTNAALRDPINPGRPPQYESGGPTDNVLDIWKIAAPPLDILAPDIYMDESAKILKVLDLYHRPGNPMFVPEIAGNPASAKYFFSVLGHEGIGFSPFGLDYTNSKDESIIEPFAANYELIGPMQREIARLNFEGKLQTVVEQKGTPTESLNFGLWKAIVSYGLPAFGYGRAPQGNADPTGRALVAQLGPNQFLVSGFHCRVDFALSDSSSIKKRQFLKVENGTYQDGTFLPMQILNGDQTDYGLNFLATPEVLRVSLATY